MKKLIVPLLIAVMLLTGCVGSEDKKYVRETLSAYFAALNAGEYEKANAYTVRAEEDIYEDIDDESVNDVIFENISYEIWSIDKEGDFLIAEVVIRQLSIKTAYIDAVKEYAKYVEDAKAGNKVFTDEALEDKWNEIFFKHVSKVEETVTMKCDVYIHRGETPEILMTSDFRNCLFGGELDAIKMLNDIS